MNNEYQDEQLAAEPPSKPVIEKIRRNILAEKPRVTRFAIKWYAILSQNTAKAIADVYPGTQKPPRRRSSRQSNPKPMLFPMTKGHMALTKVKKRNLRQLKPVHRRLKAKMSKWTALRRTRLPRPKTTTRTPVAK